ncbi:phosphoenolpyruvate carboxykinase [Lodderomyces elongisporus NRRL YB-4239]|uniref:Phosphoenolpyruvate carboxykinase (ATP) n=1 Tax=Lodderomyces elongisporus (strain ATCC 11503 / CBS 2605 / JCM 1781 / NBRC 1676 / NRRL YB-4239) TaxID=379508 RepID=A5DRR9_LODEL|nr:phosphoenolpyruvate carboxykinase [Lodderomyces elongisporus NRRL YB-4239]
MAPPAVESTINFEGHPSIKTTVDPLVKKLNLKGDTVIRHNAPPPTLYEDGLLEKGTTISSTGALMAYSGEKTGRSPKDKRIVDEETSSQHIWWGPVNKQVDELTWKISRSRALDYLRTREKLFVVDAFAGWDPKYRIKVRIICARAYHALFMTNMLIRPTKEELENFGEPDFTIYNAGQFPANVHTKGMTSSTSVEINFKDMEMVILGTEYAGEMKKGIFTVMFYLMPIKNKVLTLHSSANEGESGDVTLFFGLSGTGKTTLSADPNRKLIGDDEHCWSDHGVFNIEGGCYAKCLDLSAEKEPEIFNSIRFGSVLENVVYDPATKVVDYEDSSITENTRCSYPIEYIPSLKIPCVGGHPKNIVLLTCDASGVLPPVSKLTPAQVMYHFISGYTSKMAGTEMGITEPTPAFSACFGQPFLVLHPMKYAQQLAEKIEQHKANAYLLNTGWSGVGAAKGGKRCPLKYTRAILDAIHSGELDSADTQVFSTFNLHVPKEIKGVPLEVLHPEVDKKEVAALAAKFAENFVKYADQATAEVKAAGPDV